MTKTPLYDLLGLPISPEALWEAGESTAKTIGEAVKETVNTITGVGLDMDASLTGFQEGKAKSPELLQQEEKAANKRIVYASLEEARRNTQGFAHERALEEEIRLEVLVMTPEEKMKALHLSTSLAEKHVKDAYHIQALRRKKKEQLTATLEQTQIASEAEVQPKSFAMGEGELLKGGENPNHFTRAAG
ncbi:hypothetical protein A3B45_02135 [Candidatus Daviesbacteria bacterium RIFCSPLOWO2_01_FULL_39_12]|uniref:Uncharacterized protein n=1 Tax=Candidatus Daviesbacteria bacterium RIFCSPLOWO2_01_FULL_39_12 TaxID=1797785 RepID=A0A1F5KUE1_9BACT|nr:MAG: hypothetical protein A3B45_02135 [Candidatus Daviesbacteria bacterium RIFCSPLOWO2_01_FULL_39_12]